MSISDISALSRATGYTARNSRPYEKNTLYGFVNTKTLTELILHETTLCEKDGECWIGMQVGFWTKPDGTISYKPQVDLEDAKTRDCFQSMLLRAIDNLLRESL